MLTSAGLVADAKAHNDNATAGIVPSMFNTLIGYATATLPCRRFYIEGSAELVTSSSTSPAGPLCSSMVRSTTPSNLEFRLGPSGGNRHLHPRQPGHHWTRDLGQKERPAAAACTSAVMATSCWWVMANSWATCTRHNRWFRRLVTVPSWARCSRATSYAQATRTSRTTSPSRKLAILAPRRPRRPGPARSVEPARQETACVGGKYGACRGDADCCSQMICSDGKCVEPAVIY